MLRSIISASRCAKCVLKASEVAGKRGLHASSSLASRLSDFQLRKITQEFDHMYDMDGDGYMDKNELEIFKKRLRKFVEMVKGQAVKDVYGAGYEDFWDVLKAKAAVDKKGRINRESWIKLWEKVYDDADGKISFDSLPQFVRIMPRAIFPVMDTKGDGVLDAEEYNMFWHHVGQYPLQDPHTLLHIFSTLTDDGKHDLNLKRTEELYADFYLSNDPTSPGRYIAGPIVYT